MADDAPKRGQKRASVAGGALAAENPSGKRSITRGYGHAAATSVPLPGSPTSPDTPAEVDRVLDLDLELDPGPPSPPSTPPPIPVAARAAARPVEKTPPPIAASEAHVAGEIERAVLRDLEADRLDLPPLPTAAMKTVQQLANPDFRVEQVAAVIESDPLLAAQLVRLVNSAAFAGRQPIHTIRDCVTRLGADELRTFLYEIAARQVIESRNPRIAEFCRGLWEHSLAVALLAREIVLASDKQAGEGSAAAAYLAGLLHDVGKPLLATLLVAAEQRLVGSRTSVWIQPDTWLAFILAKHRAVAVALSRKWHLPPQVGRSIEDSVEFDAQDPRSLANAVRLANALTKLSNLYLGKFDWEEVASSSFIGQQLFVLTDQQIERMLTSVREQLARRSV